MADHKRPLWKDLGLRVSGIALIVAGAFAINLLYQMVHLPPKHEATAAELGLAAIGFLGLSLGSVLVTQGTHIFDRIEISARWAQSLPSPPHPECSQARRLSPPHAPVSNVRTNNETQQG